MALSATQRDAEGLVFRLNDSDEKDPNVATRLDAFKSMLMHDDVAEKALADAMAERAWHAARPGHAVVVFCNRRTVAQAVYALLGKRIKAEGASIPIELLVGERRVHERQQLASSPAFQRFVPGRHANGSRPASPAFLVATSAGEVGVDLDADHMVCDLVEWERMVQRFGRVNRRPEPSSGATIDIIPVLEDKDREAEPPDKRLERLRAPLEHPSWAMEPDGRRSASPKRLQQLRRDSDFSRLAERAQTPEPLRPSLTMALLDAWAMTSLPEHSGRPEVQPWIRGWVEDEPQTRLVWRRLFPLSGGALTLAGTVGANRRHLDEFFDAAAPHVVETLEAPSYRAVEILKRRAVARSKHRAAATDRHPPIVVVLEADGSVERYMTLHELVAEKADRLVRGVSGRTLIVDARLGGLDEQGLLDPDEDALPITIDSIDPNWPDLGPTVGIRIVDGKTNLDAAWRVEHQWHAPTDSDGDEAFSLRVDVWRDGTALRGDPAVARRAQELDEHHRWVVAEIERIAERLAVFDTCRRGLEVAAAHHDSGKARPLWQRAMGAPRDGRVYAKTIGRTNPRLLTIGRRTFRHEFGSLGALSQNTEVLALGADVADLILHLVAAHHGHGRPMIAAVDPADPPSVLASRAQEVALRFHRVHRRWGPWGLAWWEAVFRAADGRASQKVNQVAEPR
jgi:CRISPR-associated endonuclease/helicase Cas3